MIPYLFLFIVGSLVYFSRSNELTKMKIIFFTIAMVFIAGLRDMIGGYDVYIYGEVFEARGSIGDFKLFDFGFNKFNQFLYFFHTSREFMFFATAFVILATHVWVIEKTSVQSNLAVFIYFCKFFLFTFIYLRQGLGMALIWFAIYFLLKNNKLYAYFLVFIAFFFHKSSLIFIPFLVIDKIKFSYFQMIVIFVFFTIVALSPLGSLLTIYLAENIDNKYAVYTNKFSEVNVFYVVESGLLIYLLFKFKQKFYEYRKGIIIYNGIFVYVCLQLMGLTNATFIRLGWYFLIFLFLFIAQVYLYITDEKLKRNYKLLVYIYFSLVFVRLLFYYDDGDLMPFKFIFQDFERNGMWEFMEYRTQNR